VKLSYISLSLFLIVFVQMLQQADTTKLKYKFHLNYYLVT